MKEDQSYKKQSAKTLVIELLFNLRWDKEKRCLRNDLVTLTHIANAIRKFNKNPPKGLKALSDQNPANFFKDFVRRTSSANRHWPQSVLQRGFTAVQDTGGGRSFRFVPLPLGQVTPFLEAGNRYPKMTGEECRFKLQSLSLDIKSRLLGRRDESWLMQVAVKLYLVQSHLALCSKNNLIQVSELQQNIKQSKAEIDGLYLGKITADNSMLITLEAKGKKDDILESQIVQQVNAVMSMKSIHRNLDEIAGNADNFFVLPMAMKVIDKSIIYIAEYAPIKYQKNLRITEVTLTTESICEILPPVDGLS
ncbi:MAG TPA: hypothetical protein VGO47_08595 [Chlamydiales bacterium]|jgi:hypothetical protein|nr:hypothetical protein [Chlamydiales bacterium]